MVKWNGDSDDEWGGPGSPPDTSQPSIISPQEPQIQFTVENKLIDFSTHKSHMLCIRHQIV